MPLTPPSSTGSKDIVEVGSPLKDPANYLRVQSAKTSSDGRIVLPAWGPEREQRLREYLREKRERIEINDGYVKERQKNLEKKLEEMKSRRNEEQQKKEEESKREERVKKLMAKKKEQLASKARERSSKPLHEPPQRIIAAHTHDLLHYGASSSVHVPYSDLKQSEAYIQVEEAIRGGNTEEVRGALAEAHALGVTNKKAECYLNIKDTIDEADRLGCLRNPEQQIPQLEKEIRRSYLVQLKAPIVQKAKKRVEMEKALQDKDVRSMEIFLAETRAAGIDVSYYRQKVAQAKLNMRIEDVEAKAALRNAGTSHYGVYHKKLPKRMLQVRKTDLRPLEVAISEGERIGVDTVIGQSVLKVADAIIKDDAPLILSSLEDAASWLKEHKVSTSNLEVVKNAFSIIEKRSRSIIDNANRYVDDGELRLLCYIVGLNGMLHKKKIIETNVDELRQLQMEHSSKVSTKKDHLQALWQSVTLKHDHDYIRCQVLASIGAGLFESGGRGQSDLKSAVGLSLQNGIEDELPELITRALHIRFGTDTSVKVATPGFQSLFGDQWIEFVTHREQMENEVTQAIASGSFTKAAKLAAKLNSLAAFEDMYLPVYNEDAVGLRITMELETRLDKLYAFVESEKLTQKDDRMMALRCAIAKSVKSSRDDLLPFAPEDSEAVHLISLSNCMEGHVTATLDVDVDALCQPSRGVDEFDSYGIVNAFREKVQEGNLTDVEKTVSKCRSCHVQDYRWKRASLPYLLNTLFKESERPVVHPTETDVVLVNRIYELTSWEHLSLLGQAISKLQMQWPQGNKEEVSAEWQLLEENVRRLRAYAKSFLKSYIFQDMEEGGKAWTDHLRMLLERLGMDDFDTVSTYVQHEALESFRAASEEHKADIQESFNRQWNVLEFGRMLSERTLWMLVVGSSSVEEHKIDRLLGDVGIESESHWEGIMILSLKVALHCMKRSEFAATFQRVAELSQERKNRIATELSGELKALLDRAIQHKDSDTAVDLLAMVLADFLWEDVLGEALCSVLVDHMVMYCHWKLFKTVLEKKLQPLLSTFASYLEDNLPQMVKATSATSKAGGDRLRFSLNAGSDIIEAEEELGFKMPEETLQTMRMTLERSKPLLLRGMGKCESVVNNITVSQQLIDEANEWRSEMQEQEIFVLRHQQRPILSVDAALTVLENRDEGKVNEDIETARHTFYHNHYLWLNRGVVSSDEAILQETEQQQHPPGGEAESPSKSKDEEDKKNEELQHECEVYIAFNPPRATDAVMGMRTQLKFMAAAGELSLTNVPEDVKEHEGMRIRHTHVGEWSYEEVEAQVRGAKCVIVVASSDCLNHQRTVFEIRCAIRHEKPIALVHFAEESSPNFKELEGILEDGPEDVSLALSRLTRWPFRWSQPFVQTLCRRCVETLGLS